MRYAVTRFKTQAVALKELEPFVRSGWHLYRGKPFRRFGGMRSREALANWLLCAVMNSDTRAERFTFTSDPLGSDGIVYDSSAKTSYQTEHVMVPKLRASDPRSIEALIVQATKQKQEKGGKPYAAGKILIVFLDAGGGEWFPNRAAKLLPATDFIEVWVVGLQSAHDGNYVYGVSKLEMLVTGAPTWTIHIASTFDAWTVHRLQ